MEAIVKYHREGGSWWADSPDIDGWSASAHTHDALREVVREGLFFATGRYPALKSSVIFTFDAASGNCGQETFRLLASGLEE